MKDFFSGKLLLDENGYQCHNIYILYQTYLKYANKLK